MTCVKLMSLFLLTGLLKSVSRYNMWKFFCRVTFIFPQIVVFGNFTFEVDVHSFNGDDDLEYYINRFFLQSLESAPLAQSRAALDFDSGLPRQRRLVSTQPWPVC